MSWGPTSPADWAGGRRGGGVSGIEQVLAAKGKRGQPSPVKRKKPSFPRARGRKRYTLDTVGATSPSAKGPIERGKRRRRESTTSPKSHADYDNHQGLSRPKMRRQWQSSITRYVGPVSPLRLRPAASGMRNLGNTCYMNAILQALVSLQCFHHDVAQREADGAPHRGPFHAALVDLLRQRKEKPGVVNPSPVKQAIGAKASRFADYSQQDAHEFLGGALEQLDEDMKPLLQWDRQHGTPPGQRRHPVRDNFAFRIRHTLTCPKCGDESHITEAHVDACVDVSMDVCSAASDDAQPASEECDRSAAIVLEEDWMASVAPKPRPPSVQDQLNDFFAVEQVERKCSKCGSETATMSHELVTLPRILIVGLKRFRPNFTTNTMDKVSVRLTLSPTIDVGHVLAPDALLPIPPLEGAAMSYAPVQRGAPVACAGDSNGSSAARRLSFPGSSPASSPRAKAQPSSSVAQPSPRTTPSRVGQPSSAASVYRKESVYVLSDEGNSPEGNTPNDADLQRVLELSRAEAAQREADLEAQMERAIAASLRDQGMQREDCEDCANVEDDRLVCMQGSTDEDDAEMGDGTAATEVAVQRHEEGVECTQDDEDDDGCDSTVLVDESEDDHVVADDDVDDEYEAELEALDVKRRSPKTNAASDGLYDLCCIVVHFGGTSASGHYVCDVAPTPTDGTRTWQRFNDSIVKEIPERDEHFRKGALGDTNQRNAYILFYAHNSVTQRLKKGVH